MPVRNSGNPPDFPILFGLLRPHGLSIAGMRPGSLAFLHEGGGFGIVNQVEEVMFRGQQFVGECRTAFGAGPGTQGGGVDDEPEIRQVAAHPETAG